MALKGTAIIELTNVKTGEKERYEEHNLITKALEYMHQPIGALKSPLHPVTTDIGSGSKLEPAYRYILGGLVLWDTNIEEDASIVAQPHGVRMVGCAAYNQVNATTSPCRGSYNAAESYFTNSSVETSMKFVYDFATNQANGTIKCLSLTSFQGGMNGFGGDKTWVDPISGYGPFSEYMGSRVYTKYTFGTTADHVLFIDPSEDAFVDVMSVTTTSVTLRKRAARIYQRSVFKDVYTGQPVLDLITVQLPTSLSGVGAFAGNYDVDNDMAYVYVSPSSSISSNGTFYVIAINMATYEATVYTLKSPVSVSISRCNFACYNGTLYINGIYKINLADGTRTTLSMPKGRYSSGRYQYESIYDVINGMLYFTAYYDSNNTDYRIAMLDPTTDEIRLTSYLYGMHADYRYGRPIPIKGHPLNYYFRNSGDDGYIVLNPNYLATINNLARPIEKTSDKTMKITYTIQEM